MPTQPLAIKVNSRTLQNPNTRRRLRLTTPMTNKNKKRMVNRGAVRGTIPVGQTGTVGIVKERAVVVMESETEDTAEPLGVTEIGETMQVE
jgi:hypothetical protein